MTDLLSKEEYVAIAGNIKFPILPFINGQYQKPAAGNMMVTINPATGETLAHVYACDSTDVDYAVQVSRNAFDTGVWSQQHPTERKAVLLKLALLIEENQRELAVLESLESGKPISECVLTDYRKLFRLFSGMLRLLIRCMIKFHLRMRMG